MNRAISLLIIVVLLMISGFMNYADYLQQKIDNSMKLSQVEKSKSEIYYDINVFGEKILLLSSLSEAEKKEIWNASVFKNEMMDFFPNFIQMSTFVNRQVIDNGLFKEALLNNIKNTEEQYIGGRITGQSAIETLSTF